MLTELANLRQTDGRRRRWFRSDREDLIVWFSKDGSIWGFQLCYNRDKEERALTWRLDYGFSHERIDDGESSGLEYKRTPILVADGMLDTDSVLHMFLEVSEAVPKSIVDFVVDRIGRYPNVNASNT